MKVLVACEFSGVVRDAFAARGHEAWSCDILPSEQPGPHIWGDVTGQLYRDDWDMIIAFPPCTHLAKSGARYWPEKRADGRQQVAIDFVKLIYNAPAAKVAIENPVGVLSTLFRKPDQIVQPHEHGDPWTKATCLWLKGLPKLRPSNVVESQGSWVGGGHMGAGKLPGKHRDPRERSRTFKGMAEAMADQWSRM